MKASWLIGSCLVLVAQPLLGDTIYQTTSQGKEIALQRDAIVIQQDSSFVVYKHFDLKERRVTVVRLNRGSLPFRVQVSDAGGRAQIIEVWKRFGHKVNITDQAGKIFHVFDLYLDFYPPGGRGSLLESIPPRTSFPMQLDNGGAEEIDFDKIDRVEIQGDRLSVALREGKSVTGKFLMPTTLPAEVRVLGITEKYDPASEQVFDFSVPLSQLKLISFE
ncbi:MAG TPA: hypothetical protein VKO18_03620 [Terriglobia bacterium]|nr:hypothetical protein [Terriglobia bacterium]